MGRGNGVSHEITLAHDLGTTGNKATLFTPDGTLLASHYFPYATDHPRPGWAEQDPADWQRAFIESTRAVLSQAGVRAKDLAAVTFSGHMLGCIPVRCNGELIRRKALLWADYRSEKQARAIEERIGWEAFYRRTGGGLELALYPAAKLMWLKKNEPQVYKEARWFLGTKDWLTSWLTGRFVTDFSDASNTGLFDLAKRRWADDIVRELGLDIEKLPDEILPSSTAVGGVLASAAKEAGLVAGTPVVLGGGDVPCAAVGAGVVSPGDAYNYIGSASWVATATSQGVLDLEMRPFSLCHLVPDMYVSQLATYSAGVVHAWFKDQICIVEGQDAGGQGRSAFALMDETARSAPPGARGLLFLPHMRSGGAPFHDLDARGALLGLELGHTRADVLRAVLEGISLNIGLLCEALEKGTGTPFGELRVIGGGARSRLWLSILASVLDRNVVTLAASQEANCLGAAMTAFVGLGRFSSFREAADAMIAVEETVAPNAEAVSVYRKRARLFRQAYCSVSSVHRSLGQVEEGERIGPE
jgi:xylulokinase